MTMDRQIEERSNGAETPQCYGRVQLQPITVTA